jgi:hypothetical protein
MSVLDFSYLNDAPAEAAGYAAATMPRQSTLPQQPMWTQPSLPQQQQQQMWTQPTLPQQQQMWTLPQQQQTWTQPTSTTNQAFQPTHYCTENLNLLANTNAYSDIVITLQQGEPVQMLQTGAMAMIAGVSAPWLRVQTASGYTGWCFSGYLQQINTQNVRDTGSSMGNAMLVKIVNNTGYDVYMMYMNQSTSKNWGRDIMEKSEILENGDSYEVYHLPYPLDVVNHYDICLIDANGQSYTKLNVLITRNTQIVFTSQDLDR